MDEITDEQKKVVEELRRKTIEDVSPKMLEDVHLFYRFSKARDFNLEEAETMLRKHIAWRKEHQIDTILTDYKPPEVFVKYAASTHMCFDKEGSVVRFHELGRIDMVGLLNASNKNELMKFCFFEIEKDRDMMIKHGKNSGEYLYSPICNFEELSYAKCTSFKTIEFIMLYMKAFFDNHPETLRRLRVINAPSYFSWVFAMVKPVLPDSIYKKMRIYGADGWKEDLLEFIDADVLPACLGGNKTDPDGNPLCETFINRGKTVPKSYYSKKKSKNLSLGPDAQKLTIRPFSKEEITFEVKEKNTYLEWEFETKTKDIKFSLVFREETSKTFECLELIPPQRIDTQNESEQGCFTCENPGHYTIVFDNSYSWFHSKEILFKAGLCNSLNGENNDAKEYI